MAQSAQDVLRQMLDEYGLGDLANWAWDQYLQSGSPSLDTYKAELFQKVTETQVFKSKYPAYQTLIQQGKGISIEAYRQYTQQIQDMSRHYGIPTDMYGTPDAVGRLLTNGVSVSEANDRFQMAAQASYNVPEEVRQALREDYGIDQGGLIAYWLDPDKATPLLQKQFTTAQVQGAAKMQGVQTSQETAQRLAEQGVQFGDALNGFGTVKTLEGLQFAGGDQVSQDQITGAVFGSAEDKAAVQRVQRARQAEFSQGGGPQGDQRGVAGLGTATR